MKVRLTDPFGNTYLIEDAEFIDTALFGKCIRGWYRVEGEERGRGPGDFRLDTARSWEVVSGQMELEAA